MSRCGGAERTATCEAMKSQVSEMFWLVSVLCTVFIVFALVSSRADKGKGRLRQDPPAKQVSHKRPKPTVAGQRGIAGLIDKY